jgi:spore germination protein GerM
MEVAILLVASFGLVACTRGGKAASARTPGSVNPVATAPSTAAETTLAPCAAPTPEHVRAGLDTSVKVFLYCKSNGGVMPVELHAAVRIVPDDAESLRAALTQLLLGVTPAEDEAGLGSAFSSSTAGGLRGVGVKLGIARLDLTAGFEATSNFSTSNLAGVVFSQIEATVFQFPDIHGIGFAIEGQRWCGWEAGDCGAGPLLKR